MALFFDDAPRVSDPMLARAYRLAELGRGATSPNPVVGCVIAHDGVVVGEGWHERAGGPHAEVVALRDAGADAAGADVYVTLEPCNHAGRTPPCVSELVAAGVRSVTIGMPDPNPHVKGGGAAALAQAGVRVAWAEDPTPFERQNEAWLTVLRTGRPFVRVKVAFTLDGRPALAPATRARITGSGGSEITMLLRSEASSIAVGAGTVLADDPLLTCRLPRGTQGARSPRRYVISRRTIPEPSSRVFHEGSPPAALVTTDEAVSDALALLEEGGVRVLRYDPATGIEGALRAIAEDGANDVLIEAGPGLLSALWRARAIDEMVVVTAGGMGGVDAPPGYQGPPDGTPARLDPPMRAVKAVVVGEDVVSVWRPSEAGRTAQEGRDLGTCSRV